MLIVKNTYGRSTAFNHKNATYDTFNTLSGSSLERKKNKAIKFEVDLVPNLEREIAQDIVKKKGRCMSHRTKRKLRDKIIAFLQIHKLLTFATLTFLNEVSDEIAIKILHEFLDNVGKRSNDFQYIWVAEKQAKNRAFKNNIHFHLISTKLWDIKRWWEYWMDLQKRHNILPREENFKPTSAFDVKYVHSSNIRGIVKYLTKYVTKNDSQFNCQVWNCSKKISNVYTDEYTDINIIRDFERLEKEDLLGGKMITRSNE